MFSIEPIVALLQLYSPITLFNYILGVISISYLFDSYLAYRQYRVYVKSSERPTVLHSIIDEETFQKSRAYSIDRKLFAFVSDAYEFIKLLLILHFQLIAPAWLWCSNWTSKHLGHGEVLVTVVVVTFLSVISLIESLPWSLYSTFVIEQRHGFNNQTLKFFLIDKIKGLVIGLGMGLPIISGLVKIIEVGGDYFFLIAYLFLFIATLFIMFIYPEFIAPIFDRYIPLPDMPLKDKIFALAAKVKFPLKKLLVVEGSKRSSHSNAYFYGFGSNKRIVLFDTLIKGFVFPGTEPKADDLQKGCTTDEQVEAVLAHELGHWSCSHLIYQLTISQINLFCMFLIFSSMIRLQLLFEPFGFTAGGKHEAPIMLKLMVVFEFIFLPYNKLMQYLITYVTRQFEFQADRYSVNLNYGKHLKESLVILAKDNLSFPLNDSLYSALTFSHPPLVERLAAIDQAIKAKNKTE